MRVRSYTLASLPRPQSNDALVAVADHPDGPCFMVGKDGRWEKVRDEQLRKLGAVTT